jgi:DNA invertase Pin-like site-specific DNA recombinase
VAGARPNATDQQTMGAGASSTTPPLSTATEAALDGLSDRAKEELLAVCAARGLLFKSPAESQANDAVTTREDNASIVAAAAAAAAEARKADKKDETQRAWKHKDGAQLEAALATDEGLRDNPVNRRASSKGVV